MLCYSLLRALSSALARMTIPAYLLVGVSVFASDPQMNDTVILRNRVAREVDVTIHLADGELQIHRDAESSETFTPLAHVRFPQIEGQPAPRIDYSDDTSTAELKVFAVKGQLELLLSDQLPISIDAQVGGGLFDMVAQGLMVRKISLKGGEVNSTINGEGEAGVLESVQVTQGSGNALLMFAGSYPQLKDVALSSQNGKIDANFSGKFANLFGLNLSGATADIDGQLTGTFDKLHNVVISTAEGEINLDLRGTFRDTADVEVESAAGSVTILLPKELGASILLSTESGKIETGNLEPTDEEGQYSTMGLNQSAAPLHLKIRTRSGAINIKAES